MGGNRGKHVLRRLGECMKIVLGSYKYTSHTALNVKLKAMHFPVKLSFSLEQRNMETFICGGYIYRMAMAIRRAALHISSVAMLIRRAALHISSVAMLIRRAALHTSSVAMLMCRAALHISSVKMAYLQSIRRTSTCSKSNISQRRRNR